MNYFIIGYQNWVNLMEVKKESHEKSSTIEKTPPEGAKKLGVAATQHVQKMLLEVPKDLRDLFTPTTEDELLQLELHLAGFSKTQADRARVCHLQNQFGLTFSPNMSLDEVIIRVRIAILKKSRAPNPYMKHLDIDSDDMSSF
ncbi:MAG: hypothetical protein ACTSV7_05415 [Candidatus Baldrarchaeia archaeon]